MATKMMAKDAEKSGTSAESKACVHHWIIAPPDGPTSIGVCKKCGAVKEFENHIGFSTWENETATLRRLAARVNQGAERDLGPT